jgi:hypothetical protein
MSISIDSYRASIGNWYFTCLLINAKLPKPGLTPIKIKTLLAFILCSHGVCIGILLILRCGDVHPNPGPSYDSKSLKICHVNIQSLYLRAEPSRNYRRKIDELESILINDHKLDIICISETWLDNIISDTKVDITGYKFRRKDRLTCRAGGAAMYITHALPHRRALELELPNIDLLWIELQLNGKRILVGTCYRPPGQSVDEVEMFMSNLNDSMELVFRSNPESIFLFGDYNDSSPIWDSDHNKSELGLRLYDFVNTNDLHQLITEPTHIDWRGTANILDLLITDSPGYILNQNQHLLPPIGSKHQIVYAELRIQYNRDKVYTREIWDYSKGDYTGLLEELHNIPWDNAYRLHQDIDDIANYWQKTFMEACKTKIPNRTIKIRPRDKPWITHEVQLSIRKRNRQYKRFKRTRLPEHESIWKHEAKTTNYLMNMAKKNHNEKTRKLLMDPATGVKKYWKIAKQVYGSKKITSIPSLMVGNSIITTSIEKAKHFTSYFAEQQTLPPLAFNHRLAPIQFLTNERLESIQTTPYQVLKILKSLDTGKANGSDGISNRLLKETSTAIARPLSDLFNKSFEMTKVPKIWKESNICPIFKKDDKSIVTNYRPISLLSCVGKVQERIVYVHLYRYLKNNNLLTWRNSGFKELDSAMNQLIYITDKVYKALESGKEVCLVFLDVSKAFDRVWHAGLLHKLRCLGIDGDLFDWLSNYLADRRIRAVINGQTSPWEKTNAGVPQGSILGPLLFLVFVNDITEYLESDIHLFADDTSLMEIIENHVASYAKLNRDLTKLTTWANKWLVTFNPSKTVFLQVSRKLNPAPKPILIMNGTKIKEVTSHKHIGLTINQTLTWSDHISQVVHKASKCIGLLQRISRDVPRQCLETLYKSMILPIMEYGDIIYDGSADLHLKRLEGIQRKAALSCTGAYRHTNHERLLEELGWPTLSARRKSHRLNVMFKIQNGLTPLYLKEACPPLTRDRTNYILRSALNITTPQQRTTCYQKSFYPQTIKEWNSLPRNQRLTTSLDSFKESQKAKAGFKNNKLFHHNSSKAAIDLTRIRLGLSGLSAQRFDYNHINDPRCLTCGARSEDPQHFFLTCPTYAHARHAFLQNVSEILHELDIEIDFNKRSFRNSLIETLLKGSEYLNHGSNVYIMLQAQNFIKESRRFP